MLFSEMVREISKEESLIDDDMAYGGSTEAWMLLHDYGNITLSEATLIVWRMRAYAAGSAGNVRLKIGSYYVYGELLGNGVNKMISGISWIAAGVHSVRVESKSDGTFQVEDFQLGRAKFSDAVAQALAAYSSTITKQVASRKTAVGPLNEAIFAVVCWAKTPGAQTYFENIGDALTNGVSLKVDGQQVDWDWRNQDSGSHENAAAYYYGALSVGVNHTFEIVKDNANTVVHIAVIGCPWLLLGDLREPINLDFAQGSTLYLMLEPLHDDPTKTLRIGKKRSVSFGNSTDYYSSASGTGLLPHSYTFETVEVEESLMLISGFGGCISILAVDER